MSLAGTLRRRWDGDFTVDPWGLDRDLVWLLSPVFSLRWGIDVEGADAVPEDGPVVLVLNRRVGLSEPFVVARGVRLATGRFVRTVATPDVAPVGPLLRRLGGVLDRPDEIRGLLRAGEIVAVASDRSLRRERVGPVDPGSLAPALDAAAVVLPVAVSGRELGRRWRVRVGAPLAHPAGRGPGAAAALADGARLAVQALLDQAD